VIADQITRQNSHLIAVQIAADRGADRRGNARQSGSP
jgi:hypothetical protein